MRNYDVIIVGGGHAGCEAAAAAARMGAAVALISFTRDAIGAMSCNPAIGGLGKGHLVREVDAFDGIIARAADHAAIHYRMLNASKGAAVQGPRVQADRRRFKQAVHDILNNQDDLDIIEGAADSLIMDGAAIQGVVLSGGQRLSAGAVVLATGTFLNGKLHCGMKNWPGGRIGEASAMGMAQQLRALDLPIARLKTGTPPRLDGRTIDWGALEEQSSDAGGWTMSAMSDRRTAPQLFCAITRTNEDTHRIIRASLDRSPLFAGEIEGVGPRYCPSIEDKVHRFGDRDGHQVFLEPEGLDDAIVYPNGISTSLPADVQHAMIRSMRGMGRAEIVQPGYAVEYDYVDPRALGSGLGVSGVAGLFLAGQINGTTGYEEASAQGLVAGLNAAAYVMGRAPIHFNRADSYIGVMIDDLTLQGVSEPYRMLTARAEYRLRLRSDNAEARLTPQAIAIGCISRERQAHYAKRKALRSEIDTILGATYSGSALAAAGIKVKTGGASMPLTEWLRFPDVDAGALATLLPDLETMSRHLVEEAVQDYRYAPYVARQEAEISKLREEENIHIPPHLLYSAVAGLSNEMVERLTAARPATLAAASRIRGITPAALAAILVHTRRRAA